MQQQNSSTIVNPITLKSLEVLNILYDSPSYREFLTWATEHPQEFLELVDKIILLLPDIFEEMDAPDALEQIYQYFTKDRDRTYRRINAPNNQVMIVVMTLSNIKSANIPTSLYLKMLRERFGSLYSTSDKLKKSPLLESLFRENNDEDVIVAIHRFFHPDKDDLETPETKLNWSTTIMIIIVIVFFSAATIWFNTTFNPIP